MSQDLYQHYRPEESAFIDQAQDWIQQVLMTYAAYTTPFLTPREQLILRHLSGSYPDDLRVYFSGGYEGAERQRACLSPLYYQPEVADYDLAAYKIRYPRKFGQISHGQILGTLLSTGITRDRVGDIITDGESWHLIVDEPLGQYLSEQVTQIAKVGVVLEPLALDDLLEPSQTWREETVIVSSLRLDTLLSSVYSLSRQRAKESIQRGLVKLNFMTQDRPDVQVELEDIVSLRRHGRFWVHSMDGRTRKDNYILTVNVLEA